MDFFRSPGGVLDGADREAYDEAEEWIHKATSEFLVRTDWNCNIQCSDMINTIQSAKVLNEVVFLLRRKLAHKNPQIVVLTLNLMGSLVNNCGEKFHSVLLNDRKFLRDLGNLARQSAKRMGLDHKQVSDTSLDLVQSWGEAFLPKRNLFNGVVELYFTLRKEGLPFKSQQFDPSRVPIMLPAKGKKAPEGIRLDEFRAEDDDNYDDDDDDANLAAAIESSLSAKDSPGPKIGRSTAAKPSPAATPATILSKRVKSKEEQDLENVVQSLSIPMAVLAELILVCSDHRDIQNNEVAQDVLAQLQLFQSRMNTLIDQALLLDPKEVEKLFALNEEVYDLTALYRRIRDGDLPLSQGKQQVELVLQKQRHQDDHAATQSSSVLVKGEEVTLEHGQSRNTSSGGTKKLQSISIPLIPRKSAAVAHTAAAAKKTASQEGEGSQEGSQGSQQQAHIGGAMDDPFARETSTALDSLVAAAPTDRPLDSAGSAAGVSNFTAFPVDWTSCRFAPQSQQPSLLSVFDDSGAVLQPTVLTAPLPMVPVDMNPYVSFGQPNGYHSSASLMHQHQGYSSASQGSITSMLPFQHTTPIGSQYTGPPLHSSMGFFPATQNAGLSVPPSIHPAAGETHSSSFFSAQTHSLPIAGVNYATQTPSPDSLYNQPIQTLYPVSQPISQNNMSSNISSKPNPPSDPFDL